MISIRRANERGHAQHGWLESYHTFSFADYHDPRYMGVGNLRVINEDRILPDTGFGTHSHRDMEIISYVLEGELAHQDSMGNGTPGAANAGVIRPGDIQRMSAGTGVRHSEFNHSKLEPTHFLQIWILPSIRSIKPDYEQRHFDVQSRRGVLKKVVSPTGDDGSVRINADASIHIGLFDSTESAEMALDPKRLAYVQVARGDVEVSGHQLSAGDALLLDGETRLAIANGKQAEVLVFDLSR